MKTYRKRIGHDTWHWCKNCSNWPETNYDEIKRDGRPTTGELCNECLAKENANTCE